MSEPRPDPSVDPSSEPPRLYGRYMKAMLLALLGFLLLAGGSVWTVIALLWGPPRGALTPTLVTLGGAIGFMVGVGVIRRARKEERRWYHERGMRAPGEKDPPDGADPDPDAGDGSHEAR